MDDLGRREGAAMLVLGLVVTGGYQQPYFPSQRGSRETT